MSATKYINHILPSVFPDGQNVLKYINHILLLVFHDGQNILIIFYFQYFPMDKQMCTLEIESFGYTMSDLKFRWEDGPKSVQASGAFLL